MRREGPVRLRASVACAVGLGLSVWALTEPRGWLAATALLVSALAVARWLFPALAPSRLESFAALGLGGAAPAALLAVLALAGGDDTRALLRRSFGAALDTFDAIGRGALALSAIVVALALLEVALGAEPEERVQRRRRVAAAVLAVVSAAVFAVRLGFVASLASLPTDLLIWSEPPFLVNLLKLRAGLELYGPMADANSYSYSPGVELLHYALLAPFGFELSLGAHRALIVGCQLATTWILFSALRRRLASAHGALGAWQELGVLGAVGCVVFSSFLSPHVHPDHALMLCFALALRLVLADERPSRARSAVLVLLPPCAVAFKLTGAGIGLGLFFVYAWERRGREIVALSAGGGLALLTIPLFDRTLGAFSDYAIRLQASHPLEWARALGIPWTRSGALFVAALVALGWLALRRPSSDALRAGRRVLALTLGFSLVSLAAYVKQGGRENSLLPLAIGATSILILAAGELLSARARVPGLVATAALIASFASPPRPPLSSLERAALLAIQERATRFAREHDAAGRRALLLLGTIAWIEAGRSDVPRDQLTSASELFLGRRPELAAWRRRLTDGTYDGIFAPASALFSNPLLRELRPALSERYSIVEPAGGNWPASNDGYVIFERRNGPSRSETRP